MKNDGDPFLLEGLTDFHFSRKNKMALSENAENFSAGGEKKMALLKSPFGQNSEMEIISVFFQAQLMESLSVSNMYYIWLNPNFILYKLVLVLFSIELSYIAMVVFEIFQCLISVILSQVGLV